MSKRVYFLKLRIWLSACCLKTWIFKINIAAQGTFFFSPLKNNKSTADRGKKSLNMLWLGNAASVPIDCNFADFLKLMEVGEKKSQWEIWAVWDGRG